MDNTQSLLRWHLEHIHPQDKKLTLDLLKMLFFHFRSKGLSMAHGVTIDGVMGVEDTKSMGVWQGAAMDSLKYRYGTPSPTLPRPAGGNTIQLFQGWLPGGRVGCVRLLLPW
jgi:hypothetical protein